MGLKWIGSRLTYANVVATGALFVALGGGAYALSGVPDRGGVYHGCVATSGALRVVAKASSCRKTKTVRRGTRRVRIPGESAITWNQKGQPGANGLNGQAGGSGPPGASGAPGANGSPDTAAQVLSKLQTVDGTGSGLDSDTLDGIDSSTFFQGPGFEDRLATTVTGGFGVDTGEIAGSGKLTVSCADPAQPRVQYVNEYAPGNPQRVYVDDGAGAGTSVALNGGASTGNTSGGTTQDAARHVTFFAALSNGALIYDVWMTTTAAGSPGQCEFLGTRRLVGISG